MLDSLFVDLGQNSYNIYFSDNFSALAASIRKNVRSEKALIVTDSNVDKLYREEVQSHLEQNGFDVSAYAFPAGEENKNLGTISDICRACTENKLDRKSFIVALGGGVTGDMAGFAAAIYMRGIDFIQIPTTLLSQSDSSVGGKTGIDFCGGKNILGAFHQPKAVYINVSVLKTLPKREFISGMGEVIKHGIISGEEFFTFLEDNSESIKAFDANVLMKMCKMNCSVKSEVVMKDEKENGLRAVLNLGHTVGHAVEAYYDFELTHGECVGLGLAAVLSISESRKIIPNDDVVRIIEILKEYGFNTSVKIDNPQKVMEIMYMDKKADGGILKFILPKKIGNVIGVKDITEEEILQAIRSINN